MRLRILQASAFSVVLALGLAGGCTEPPLGWQGAGRLQDLPGPANDAGGMEDADGSVTTLPGFCAPDGVICYTNDDCCDHDCKSNACGGTPNPPLCAPDGVVCQKSADCCGGNPAGGSTDTGYCGGGICGATPAPVCVSEFIRCSNSMQCCNNSGMEAGGIVCQNGACCGVERNCNSKAPPLCVPYGVFCTTDTDCCAGFKCSLNNSLQLVCDIPP